MLSLGVKRWGKPGCPLDSSSQSEAPGAGMAICILDVTGEGKEQRGREEEHTDGADGGDGVSPRDGGERSSPGGGAPPAGHKTVPPLTEHWLSAVGRGSSGSSLNEQCPSQMQKANSRGRGGEIYQG